MVKMTLEQLVSEASKLHPNDGRRYIGPLALSQKNGDIPASVLFVSEAPGLRGAGSTGIPFFSLQNEQSALRFGKLMAMLGVDCDMGNGWRGHGIFVTDVVLRNPIRQGRRGFTNRSITSAEIQEAIGLLGRQIALVRPKIVVGVGQKACRALAGLFSCDVTIDGRFHRVADGLTLVGCPHPSPHNNRRKDLLKIQELLFRQLQRYVVLDQCLLA